MELDQSPDVIFCQKEDIHIIHIERCVKRCKQIVKIATLKIQVVDIVVEKVFRKWVLIKGCVGVDNSTQNILNFLTYV